MKSTVSTNIDNINKIDNINQINQNQHCQQQDTRLACKVSPQIVKQRWRCPSVWVCVDLYQSVDADVDFSLPERQHVMHRLVLTHGLAHENVWIFKKRITYPCAILRNGIYCDRRSCGAEGCSQGARNGE